MRTSHPPLQQGTTLDSRFSTRMFLRHGASGRVRSFFLILCFTLPEKSISNDTQCGELLRSPVVSGVNDSFDLCGSRQPPRSQLAFLFVDAGPSLGGVLISPKSPPSVPQARSRPSVGRVVQVSPPCIRSSAPGHRQAPAAARAFPSLCDGHAAKSLFPQSARPNPAFVLERSL